jgi:hypothetical protein
VDKIDVCQRKLMEDFEKLGAFYLGRNYDLESKQSEGLVLYDSKDLVTHAVCIGMTGSGKTGLSIGLLEEALIDGIPAIIVDPKGDLGNLLLTFPDLSPKEFEPWVNEDDAKREGISKEEYAARQAELWRNGLESWGQTSERIRRLKASGEVLIYTPGSNAGLPVSILSSFTAPDEAVRDDREAYTERISVTASSLLGLLGLEADPVRSREHILISNIIDKSWREGVNVTLEQLIGQIQKPPLTKVGVMDIETFYPARERQELALMLNNLLASPGFSTWLEGEPLDIQSMLFDKSGRPRLTIFSIAHLNDAERMFFVTLLLNQTLGWMRAQSGTTSLRALFYMDEIFGYLPPVANPPSKQPLLILLKQARAFGLGLVLATQNPVDLDYKALANIGTWFIGRLQTERDKARLLDGLEGALNESKGIDRQGLEQILSSLGKRVFLMNNIHDQQPAIFETRWTMSYLRGPLTRSQIKSLMDPLKVVRAPRVAEVSGQKPEQTTRAIPSLPQEIPVCYIRGNNREGRLLYTPMLLGIAQVHFSDAKRGVDLNEDLRVLVPVTEEVVAVDWDKSIKTDVETDELIKAAEGESEFKPLPEVATKIKSYVTWSKEFAAWVYRNHRLTIYRSQQFKMLSTPGESEGDFRVRVQQRAHELRDEAREKLRQRYIPKIAALQEKVSRAELAVERESEQVTHQKMQTAVSVGSTLLGAFLGRKIMSGSTVGRAATAARSASRASKEAKDVDRAREVLNTASGQLSELENRFKQELELLKFDASEPFETLTIKPRKQDITVQVLTLAWTPVE